MKAEKSYYGKGFVYASGDTEEFDYDEDYRVVSSVSRRLNTYVEHVYAWEELLSGMKELQTRQNWDMLVVLSTVLSKVHTGYKSPPKYVGIRYN